MKWSLKPFAASMPRSRDRMHALGPNGDQHRDIAKTLKHQTESSIAPNQSFVVAGAYDIFSSLSSCDHDPKREGTLARALRVRLQLSIIYRT